MRLHWGIAAPSINVSEWLLPYTCSCSGRQVCPNGFATTVVSACGRAPSALAQKRAFLRQGEG